MTRATFGKVRFAAIAVLAVGSLWGQQVEELRLTVGRSVVLDYPSDIRQISTSDPAVVDAIAVSTREVLLHAKGNGNATVVVWSKAGQRTIYSITVEQNLDSVRRLLKETFPNEDIHVQSTRDSLSLTGRVSSKEVADRAIALVTPFAKSIVNNLQVAPAPQERQVMLKVKFAEVNRSALEQFGVNILSTGAANTFGTLSTGQFGAPTLGGEAAVTGGPPGRVAGSKASFRVTDLLNVFAFRPDLNLTAMVRALEAQQVLQILAEPNLVTSSGKEASFLAGGEFPIPVLQGGGNAGAVTIQFREFGIRLNFKPEITDNNTIRMYVKPEVSTIDLANAIQLSGFVIPALSSRRIESNIELSEGQSFVIGGLLDDRTTENLQKIPGLSNIPLLGVLFKSREQRKTRTELVVLVTPEIAKPMAPGEKGPLPEFPRPFLDPSKLDKRSKANAPASGSKEQVADAKVEKPAEVKAEKPADGKAEKEQLAEAKAEKEQVAESKAQPEEK